MTTDNNRYPHVIRLDHIHNRSVLLDLQIIIRTAGKMLRMRGV